MVLGIDGHGLEDKLADSRQEKRAMTRKTGGNNITPSRRENMIQPQYSPPPHPDILSFLRPVRLVLRAVALAG